METKDKINGIKSRAVEMLRDSFADAEKKINKALNSGCLDIENWDSEYNSMIIPKIILIAILEDEANAYKGKGTSFQKEIEKEVKNLKLFL